MHATTKQGGKAPFSYSKVGTRRDMGCNLKLRIALNECTLRRALLHSCSRRSNAWRISTLKSAQSHQFRGNIVAAAARAAYI